MQNLIVYTIKNSPIDSNCYIIHNQSAGNALIIDPGNREKKLSLPASVENSFRIDYIILTHEHFDHIWSVNFIKDNYSVPVICSEHCGNAIIDKKKNLSLFYDQVGFETYPPDIVFKKSFDLEWNDNKIEFFLTPGHTQGSICFKIDNMMFTGDTLIKDQKTVLKLPGSNKDDLLKSLDLIIERSDSGTIFYPGHGESFECRNYDIRRCL